MTETRRQAAAVVATLGTLLAALLFLKLRTFPGDDPAGAAARYVLALITTAQLVPIAGYVLALAFATTRAPSRAADRLWAAWVRASNLALGAGAIALMVFAHGAG